MGESHMLSSLISLAFTMLCRFGLPIRKWKGAQISAFDLC
jgi:hypothetical protein